MFQNAHFHFRFSELWRHQTPKSPFRHYIVSEQRLYIAQRLTIWKTTFDLYEEIVVAEPIGNVISCVKRHMANDFKYLCQRLVNIDISTPILHMGNHAGSLG